MSPEDIELEEKLKEFFAARKRDLVLGLMLTPLILLQFGLEWLDKKLKGRLTQR